MVPNILRMAVAATELVRLAVSHFGSQAKLAEAMGLGVNGGSTVSRWANGVHALSYEHAMDLLEACGWLSLDRKPQPQPAAPTTLPQLTAEVARLADLLAAFVESAQAASG